MHCPLIKTYAYRAARARRPAHVTGFSATRKTVLNKTGDVRYLLVCQYSEPGG
jgi:hypothetical protein